MLINTEVKIEANFHAKPITTIADVVILTGVCRTGKTTLGNWLGTCRHVEHCDEPWLLMELPILSGIGRLEMNLAKSMWQSAVSELLNDVILGRRVNLRKTDLSYTYHQKTPSEIQYRIAELQSRTDVKEYLENNRTSLLLNLAETLPFLNFFRILEPRCKMIHVTRHGLSVAKAIQEKQWFDDGQLLVPQHACLSYRYQYKKRFYYIPWWVKCDEFEFFLELNDYGRSVYYWTTLMGISRPQVGIERLGNLYLEIQSEQMWSDYSVVFPKILEFMNIEPGELTPNQCSFSIKKDCWNSLNEYKKLPEKLRHETLEVLEYYGYEL